MGSVGVAVRNAAAPPSLVQQFFDRQTMFTMKVPLDDLQEKSLSEEQKPPTIFLLVLRSEIRQSILRDDAFLDNQR